MNLTPGGLRARANLRVGERREQGLERSLTANSAREGAWLTREGRRLRNFASNDYLGLAQHPRVCAALMEGVKRFGAGSGAAHLLGGHFDAHRMLEEAFAQWLGYPAALLFGSGYAANLGVAMALLERGDCIIADRLDHASLLDAAKLSGARLLRYPHADSAAAARQLARVAPDAGALIATDGVFSMDGDVAPLASLARLESATLFVDDAHGCGATGPGGRGSVAAAGLDSADVPLLTITLGKVFGTCGAVVLGDSDLINAIVQFARPYVYSTAQPPALAHATLASLDIVRSDEGVELRARLDAHITRWRRGARELGLPVVDSHTAIQPLVLGSVAAVSAAQTSLAERGFFVGAVRPPTVPAGKARLRITLTALHTDADIDALLEDCAACCANEEDFAGATLPVAGLAP